MGTRSQFNSDMSRPARIDSLFDKIRAYDQLLTKDELSSALSFYDKTNRAVVKQANGTQHLDTEEQKWNDDFPDPLDLVERLVDFVKPDRDTILAAILYPLVRPAGHNRFVDENMLGTIVKKYGAEIRPIILDTISLWSLVHLKPGKQSPAKNLTHYTLAGILAAKRRSAVSIRSVSSEVNLSKFIGVDFSRSIQKVTFLINQANIMARLAYIAGDQQLYDSILNKALQIRDPEKYQWYQYLGSTALVVDDNAEPGIRKADRAELTANDINDCKAQIVHLLRNVHNLEPDDYTLTWRSKAPHSIDEKIGRKNRRAEELDDLQGCMIKLKVPSGSYDVDVWAEKCRAVYQTISQYHGATSDRVGSYYKAFVHKGEDKQDYYADTKTGYKAVQGNLGFCVGNKFVKAEVQVTDDVADNNNKTGAASHYLMKAGLYDYQDIVVSWKEANRQVVRGADVVLVNAVVVYDESHDLVVLRGTAAGTGCTVGHLLGRSEKGKRFQGAKLMNPNPLANRNPKAVLALDERLVTGDVVMEVVYNSTGKKRPKAQALQS